MPKMPGPLSFITIIRNFPLLVMDAESSARLRNA